jgi:hypothetical protein
MNPFEPRAEPSEAAEAPSPGRPSTDWSSALPAAARDVEDFLAETGWDQPPWLFALVPTARLLDAEPGLADRLATAQGLTPVAQEPLGEQDLAETLAGICWPETVTGCALAQEIVVLPPDAEADLDDVVAEARAKGLSGVELDQVTVRAAQGHPDRREARLVVAVLRAGDHCCLMRLRGVGEAPDEVVEHPDLAPHLVSALQRTLDAD